jgi:hypothetical protein
MEPLPASLRTCSALKPGLSMDIQLVHAGKPLPKSEVDIATFKTDTLFLTGQGQFGPQSHNKVLLA